MMLIPPEEIGRSLTTENPWWNTGAVPKRFAGLPRRAYYPMFLGLVQNRAVNRAVVLLGPRRVGKTVLATQCIQGLIDQGVNPQNILYVSIDAPTYTNLALDYFLSLFWKRAQFDSSSDFYVVFDEIQYLRDWERHLKTLVDRYPNGRFIASGSAAAALKLGSSESGAGRFTEFLLPPLTFAEYLSFIGREDELIRSSRDRPPRYTAYDIDSLNSEFENYINFGGYPEAVVSQEVRMDAPRFIKNDIIEKVLLRDLPQLYGVQNIQELNKLFTVLAYQTGQETSLENLSSVSGISKPTISRYIEYLEAAFLLFRLRRIDNRAKSFKRERAFKVYLGNPSMRAALFSPLSQSDAVFGYLAETAILGQWLHSGSMLSNLYYARWKRSGARRSDGDHGEIDLVRCSPADLSPRWLVEIKWSDAAWKRDESWSAIEEFCQKYRIRSGSFTTRTETATRRCNSVDVKVRPTAMYCYAVGKNTVRARSTVAPSEEE